MRRRFDGDMNPLERPLARRSFLASSALAAGVVTTLSQPEAQAQSQQALQVVRPPEGKSLLLSCKLGMIPKKLGDRELSLEDRLRMAAEAGFDGVDFDQAGEHTVEAARAAMLATGVFCHNAINHAHWKDRLTSADPEVRAKGVENIRHCLRVAHALGGSGVLIVVGRGNDGSPEECLERCRTEIHKLLPLAASLGQPILIENVWNQMMYRHEDGPEQGPEAFIEFVDSFKSPWVGMYYDIGNHWKYGQPGDWIRAFGHRCVKLDVKGYSRAESKWTDIGEGDLPWADVRKAIQEVGFSGWATAEVRGGDVERLTTVRQQMQKVFGL